MPYLERAEMRALLTAPPLHKRQGKRSRALLLFLYNTGARATEAVQLTIGDVDLRLPAVTLHGKGRKDRQCPLWPKTVEALQPFITQRPSTDRVFLNCNGDLLTRYGIHTLVERAVQTAAHTLPSLKTKRISPHTIRHYAEPRTMPTETGVTLFPGGFGILSAA